jgi:3-hydroxyisobutyrate dehydrogenase-like beta-hydroxyacid dehydrogenase
MAARLGFVGLGTMGAPMAGHLVQAGHAVTVWNRTPGRAVVEGAQVAPDLAALAAECDVVMLCVNRSEDVHECLAGLAPHAKPGALFIDHSTIAPPVARDLAQDLKSRGLRFVDAPITGGSIGAQNGQLTIFCGGEKADVDEALGYLEAYAKRAEYVGPSGSGQMFKMANQIAVAGALLGLCESMAFAEKAGLDLRQVLEMVGGGAGGSWAFANYGPRILSHDWSPGFSIKNQRKDFGYCREAAASIEASIPGTEVVDALLAKLQEAGRGEEATVALFEALLEPQP